MTRFEERVPTDQELRTLFPAVGDTIRVRGLYADGELIAVGGVAYGTGVSRLWMDWNDKAERFPVALVKSCRKFLRELPESIGGRSYKAIACSENAYKFVERMGLTHVYTQGNGRVYEWQR